MATIQANQKLKILECLLERPHTINELGEKLNLKTDNIRFHIQTLRTLKGIKIIRGRANDEKLIAFFALPKASGPNLAELEAIEAAKRNKELAQEKIEAKNRTIKALRNNLHASKKRVEKLHKKVAKLELALSFYENVEVEIPEEDLTDYYNVG